MALSPEERRFYVGLAIFGTFVGSGLFVVFEHSFWGWAFILVGFAGLVYSVWERFGAAVPARSTWPWIVALLLTWGLLGYDYYDRHFQSGFSFDLSTSGITKDDNSGDTFVFIGLGVRNRGAQSIATKWEMVLIADGKRHAVRLTREKDIEVSGSKPGTFHILWSDFLPEKTVQQPIPAGGYTGGYVTGIAYGFPYSIADKSKLSVLVSCENVLGTKTALEIPMIHDSFDPNIGVPGTDPK
jgi:hypothetical protein